MRTMNNYIFDKKLNFRDIGGVRNLDGKSVKKNIIFRSAHLSNLKQSDLEYLSKELKLKFVVDLRSNIEKKDRENKIPDDAEYLEIPYFDETAMGITSGMGSDVKSALKQANSRNELLEFIPDLNTVYPLIVTDEHSISQLSKVIKLIINNREGSVLFHCTAGKDRTGVTTAIIYRILNVDYSIILDDYLKTNIVSQKNAKKYSILARIFLRDKRLQKKVYDVFMADEKYLKAAMDAIDNTWGGLDNFIYNKLNISQEEINSFTEYALL